MSNYDVCVAWKNGRKRRSVRIRTDGFTIQSYGLTIGYTDHEGKKVVFDYRASAGAFVSMTTSHHVGLAWRVADRKIDVNGVEALDYRATH